MCGEIEEWQHKRQVFVRLTTNGASRIITLPHIFERVEEIRLDEILVTNFQGGVAGSAYLNLNGQGLTTNSVSLDRRPGSLILVSPLTPHLQYNNPRVLALGNMATVNSFELSFITVAGVPVTFDEMDLVLTFVCRKSEDQMEQVRKMKAAMHYPPSIKDGVARNTFDPYFRP